MDNRLTRSHTDRMLTGVAGGMAEYFDIDPVIIRLLWVLGAVFTGGVLLVVYFVMAIIMPSPPDGEDEYEDEEEYEDDVDAEAAAERAAAATDGQAAGEAGEGDDQGEDAADAEAEPKADVGATATAAATSAASSTAPLAEAPRGQSRREARQARRDSRRRARRRRAAARRRGQGALVIGSILIGIGALALVDQFSLLSFWQFWPLILIGIGGALILGRMR